MSVSADTASTIADAGELVQLDGNVALDCAAWAGDTVCMSYPGGKAGSGVYQQIISQMPPHDVYVEPFLGGGAVMLRKRPARSTIGIDLDVGAVRLVAAAAAGSADIVRAAGNAGDDGCGPGHVPGYTFLVGDAISYLQNLRCGPEWLIYCDPPYPIESRSSRRRMYRYELSDARHGEFLAAIRRLPAKAMVSGYHCPMYDQALSSWRVVEYWTVARSGGRRRECLWCNFREPVELHDYRYYGGDYRERERVKRKRARWVRRLSEMPVLERRLIESALLEVLAEGKSRQDGPG